MRILFIPLFIFSLLLTTQHLVTAIDNPATNASTENISGNLPLINSNSSSTSSELLTVNAGMLPSTDSEFHLNFHRFKECLFFITTISIFLGIAVILHILIKKIN